MYTEGQPANTPLYPAQIFEPVELRAVSAREEAIDNLTWPEDASPHVITTMQYAREASALKTAIDTTSSAIFRGMQSKIHEHEQIAGGYKQNLAERFILLSQLSKAIERAGLTLDVTLHDIQKAQSYVARAESKLEQAHFDAATAKQTREQLAAELTKVSVADRQVTNELGSLVHRRREQRLRAKYADRDPAEAEQLIQDALNRNLTDNEKVEIIQSMKGDPGSPEAEMGARYQFLLKSRPSYQRNVSDFDTRHQEATENVALKQEGIRHAEEQLVIAKRDLQTVISQREPQQQRLEMLKQILAFLSEDTEKVRLHFDETDATQPLDHQMLLKLTAFVEDAGQDRTAQNTKHVKYYETRRDAIRARTLPTAESAEHLAPIISLLQELDQTTEKLSVISAEVTQTYDVFIRAQQEKLLAARTQLGQMSGDAYDSIQSLLEIAHSQDIIDIHYAQQTGRKTQAEAAFTQRGNRIAELNTRAGQLITLHTIGTTREAELSAIMAELAQIAAAQHDARETERLRVVHEEVHLTPEERRAWIEHDLGMADTLRGYDPNTAWSHPERLPFRGVDQYLLPAEDYAKFTQAIAESRTLQTDLANLTATHAQLLNETSQLESERRQLRASQDQAEAAMHELAQRTHLHMQATGELKGRLLLATNHFKEIHDAYKQYIISAETTLATPEEAPAVVEIAQTNNDQLSIEGQVVLRGSPPEIADAPHPQPRANDLKDRIIQDRRKSRFIRAITRSAT